MTSINLIHWQSAVSLQPATPHLAGHSGGRCTMVMIGDGQYCLADEHLGRAGGLAMEQVFTAGMEALALWQGDREALQRLRFTDGWAAAFRNNLERARNDSEDQQRLAQQLAEKRDSEAR